MVIEGIDVSNHQFDIDWQAVVDSGKQFAICKATEGVGYLDSYFAQNWSKMQTAGIVRGAYHFARPSLNKPEDEYAWFVQQVMFAGGLAASDLIVLDVEDDGVLEGEDIAAWLLSWLDSVEAFFGFRPIIYTRWGYFQRHTFSLLPFNAYTFWIANYGGTWPAGAKLWQYSSTGTVAGVTGNCDLNKFDGSVEALRKLGAPAVPTPPVVDALNDLWHVAGLLDGISAHDLAGTVRESVITIKTTYGIP